MVADNRQLVSLHGNRFGIARGGHLTLDGHFLLPSYRDRMARVVQQDHFLGPTLSTFIWNVAHGSDGAAASPVINVAKGGTARGVTGAGAGATMAVNGTQICGSLNFEADQGGLEFGTSVKLSAITNVALFVGLTNQSSSLQMPGTISGGTLTGNAADMVGFLFDTAATAATWKFVSNLNGTVNAIQDTGKAPATTLFDLFQIDVDVLGNAVGTLYPSDGTAPIVLSQALALTPTVALTPVVAGFARAASGRNIDIDFIHCAEDRSL